MIKKLRWNEIDKETMYDLISRLFYEEIRFTLSNDIISIVIQQCNGSETIEIVTYKNYNKGEYNIHRLDDNYYWRERNIDNVIEMIKESENYG